MLDGRVEVRIVAGEREIFAEERQFGTSSERIRAGRLAGHADRGRQVGADPAAVRGPRPRRHRRDDRQGDRDPATSCGRTAASRAGSPSAASSARPATARAIGHDSDIDLCFLSTATTPAEHGLATCGASPGRSGVPGCACTHASASFITVRFRGPDGGAAGIDIYITLLPRTACSTRRRPCARRCRARRCCRCATSSSRAGCCRRRPTPPRCSRSSYGPNWRVPDPSFQHQPGTRDRRPVPRLVRLVDARTARLAPRQRRRGELRGRPVRVRRVGVRTPHARTATSSRSVRAAAPTCSATPSRLAGSSGSTTRCPGRWSRPSRSGVAPASTR